MQIRFQNPFPLSETLDSAPSSSPLRVSLNTQFESGIPPARRRAERFAAPAPERELDLDDGARYMDSALGNVTRTEANLGLLMRGLKHLATSVSAARDANTELIHELDALRVQLSRSSEDEQAMRIRLGQLEYLLEMGRKQAASDREFLIEQQDLFLVEIMSDYDRQLEDLRRLLPASAAGGVASRETAELIAQRDQAREYAIRCERERDAAWQELATGRAPSSSPETVRRQSTPPPKSSPSASSLTSSAKNSESGAAAIASINLRSVSVPTPVPGLAPITERATGRSGTGYSLTGDDVGE